jgi:hypothetical protein
MNQFCSRKLWLADIVQVEFGEEEGKDRNPILALLISGR